MKLPLALIALLILETPFIAESQTKTRSRSKTTQKQVKTTVTPVKATPVWSLSQGYGGDQHVYFQDYYTFYDPSRGYIYWSNGGWKTSSVPPSFLSKVDLGKARIQILKGLSLDLHPEQNYPNYMKLYPARPGDNDVPVPGVTKNTPR